jgi:hypothetical protein
MPQLQKYLADTKGMHNLLGFVNPGEKIPRRNLVKRLLDLIKGTNLFTQE